MNTKLFVLASALAVMASCGGAGNPAGDTSDSLAMNLKLSDYRPVSVFKIQESHILKAKYPVIDMHSHAYVDNVEDLKTWVQTLEDNNVEKVIIYTGAYGEEFDRIYDMYTGVSDKFEIWCGIDMSSWGTPDFPAKAVAELERCHAKGAKGVGELSDKGLGEKLSRKVKEPGLHFNDDLFPLAPLERTDFFRDGKIVMRFARHLLASGDSSGCLCVREVLTGNVVETKRFSSQIVEVSFSSLLHSLLL